MELKNFFAQDDAGNVISSPACYIYESGTATVISGLKDENGDALTNPFTGAVTGQIKVAAPNGDYDMRVTGAGRDFTMRVRFIDSYSYQASISGMPTSSITAHPRGSVLVHIGDSISVKSGEYGVGYISGWLGKGGVFEGWTSYNLASNGSPASVWAGEITTGDQNEAPADYDNNLGYNPWAAVNADPQVIMFQLGTNDIRMDGSAGAISGLAADIAELIDFLVENTSAHIFMKVPPPICYANPDPNSFTNCTNADDAAARSAALRSIYLDYHNVSNRITVVDMQKHLYGFRADSVASVVDPEGYGSLMKDTLHPTSLGQTRAAQIISRIINPSLPATSEATGFITPAMCSLMHKYALINVKGSGSGYVDIYANSVTDFVGTVTRESPADPLSNLSRFDDLVHAGAASRVFEILQCANIQIVYKSGVYLGELVGHAYELFSVDGGAGDYFRVSAPGTFSGSGVAVAYVADAQYLPRRSPTNLAVVIPLAGALPLTSGSCDGAVNLPLAGIKPKLNSDTISATRQSGSGAATVDLYVSNVWNGSYSGSVSAGVPGYKLGTLTFPDGHVQNTSWVADATNFPGGVASLPDTPNAQTVIRAVLSSGALGNYGHLTIRTGT